MARLYLDNDVSLRIAPILRQAGHDVTAARDLDLRRAADDAQLLVAVQNGWTLLTYNRRDFTMLHDAWRSWPEAFGWTLPSHHGVVVLDHAPIEVQCEAVVSFLALVPLQALVNELVWWNRHDGWRRRIVGSGWEPY